MIPTPGMYDLHNHMLPGIDDGPDDWDAAVNMLRQAADDGIRGIAATPHVMTRMHGPSKEWISSLTEELRRRSGGLKIDLFVGSEIFLTAETVAGIRNRLFHTINSSRYVLVEVPENFSRVNLLNFIFELTSSGFVPVIAHPERNPKLSADPNLLYEVVSMGAIGQLDAGSVTGHFGTDTKRAALDMLSRRLVHIMATDAHSDNTRPPLLSGGLKAVEKAFGRDVAYSMTYENPKRIIEDKILEIDEPVYNRKRLVSIF